MTRTASGTLSDGTPFTLSVGDIPVSPPPPPPVSPPSPPPATGFRLGQVPFAASSPWNTPVISTAVLTNLAWPAPILFQGGPKATNYGAAWDGYSPAVYVSASTDPVVAVPIAAGWGWPAQTLHVRMPKGATGATGTDGELLVIDGTIVHNFWVFKRTSDTTATCQSYGACDVLTGSGFGSANPFKAAGITAIGASMLGGLVMKAETDAGPILHAIALKVDFPLAKPGFVAPAIAGDGGSSSGLFQEGQRCAISALTQMPSGLSPLGQKIFVAMQKYGVFINDVAGGVSGIRVQANAYDDPTITLLDGDLPKIIPLLKKVG